MWSHAYTQASTRVKRSNICTHRHRDMLMLTTQLNCSSYYCTHVAFVCFSVCCSLVRSLARLLNSSASIRCVWLCIGVLSVHVLSVSFPPCLFAIAFIRTLSHAVYSFNVLPLILAYASELESEWGNDTYIVSIHTCRGRERARKRYNRARTALHKELCIRVGDCVKVVPYMKCNSQWPSFRA